MLRYVPLMMLPILLSGCFLPEIKHTRLESTTLESAVFDGASLAEPITKIDLTTFNGSINVRPHDESLISVGVTYQAYGDSEHEAKLNSEKLQCEYVVEAGVLSIRAARPSDQWMASAAFELLVPRDCALALATSNGTIHVSKQLATVEARTSNGAIQLTAVHGDVIARTSNGSVSVRNGHGRVTIATSNGRVAFSGYLVGDNNQIETNSGAVTLELDSSQTIAVEAKTYNGNISCSLPTQAVIDESKHHFHAKVGPSSNEPIARVETRTANGNVSIKPLAGALPMAITPPAPLASGDRIALYGTFPRGTTAY